MQTYYSRPTRATLKNIIDRNEFNGHHTEKKKKKSVGRKKNRSPKAQEPEALKHAHVRDKKSIKIGE